MTIGQVSTGRLPLWPADRTATRELTDYFARIVFDVDMADSGVSGGVKCLTLSAIALISSEPFNWEAAENRADWEERHGRFVEFNNVKDLLSNLHS